MTEGGTPDVPRTDAPLCLRHLPPPDGGGRGEALSLPPRKRGEMSRSDRGGTPALVVDNHAAAVLAALEGVEGLVDLVERVAALDDVVDLDASGHVHVDQLLECPMRRG